MIEKKCNYCSKIYEAYRSSQKFCSTKCKIESSKEKCSICNKINRVSERNNELPICSECNRKKQICFYCKKQYKRIYNKFENNLICSKCNNINNKQLEHKHKYKSKLESKYKIIINDISKRSKIYFKYDTCKICLKYKKIREINNEYICKYCFSKNNPKKECEQCHKIKVKLNSKKRICSDCIRKNKYGICSICKEYRSIHSGFNETMICGGCHKLKNSKICIICNQNRKISRTHIDGPVCDRCNKIYNKLNNINECKIYFKYKKSFQHYVFEKLYNFKPETTISFLINNKYIINNNYNKLLRYDYFNEKNKVLIEINEPAHYSWDEYKKVIPKATKEKFIKYQKDFEEKINIAKENNIKLIIIDIKYKMNFEELKNIYQKYIQ